LVIEGLAPPATEAAVVIDKNARDAGPKQIAAGKPLALNFSLALPPKQHLTDGAPISLQLTDGTRTLHTATLSPPPGQAPRRSSRAVVPAEALAPNRRHFI